MKSEIKLKKHLLKEEGVFLTVDKAKKFHQNKLFYYRLVKSILQMNLPKNKGKLHKTCDTIKKISRLFLRAEGSLRIFWYTGKC
ncbi:hypothetical protein [Enterococcus sp. SMC-9]|uniref:hypothetical protein n=1 Tax=Enterococcus sp. SMC-9 TaxID=2862343 RepID=UPI001E3D869F|nr:hypothetical protein [Enterococcus sp. SMC-9]